MKAQSALCCFQLQNWDKILHVGQDICNCGDIINSDMDSEMHPISWNEIIMVQTVGVQKGTEYRKGRMDH